MATEPSARKIGLRIMIRVSSTVVAVWAASKPGVMNATIAGAATSTMRPRTARPMSIRLVTVETTRQARSCSPVAKRPDDDRDQRRGQRPGGDELEDEVRDPERGEERVELRRSIRRCGR